MESMRRHKVGARPIPTREQATREERELELHKDMDLIVKATFLTTHEIGLIHALFSTLDDNGNGKVDRSELRNIEEMNTSPFADRILRVFDGDGSGEIELDEMIDMFSTFSTRASLNADAHVSFCLFDFDEDGLLSQQDIEMTLRRMLLYPLAEARGTSEEAHLNQEIKEYAARIMESTAFDRDEHNEGSIEFDEWEQAMNKSEDFRSFFSLALQNYKTDKKQQKKVHERKLQEITDMRTSITDKHVAEKLAQDRRSVTQKGYLRTAPGSGPRVQKSNAEVEMQDAADGSDGDDDDGGGGDDDDDSGDDGDDLEAAKCGKQLAAEVEQEEQESLITEEKEQPKSKRKSVQSKAGRGATIGAAGAAAEETDTKHLSTARSMLRHLGDEPILGALEYETEFYRAPRPPTLRERVHFMRELKRLGKKSGRFTPSTMGMAGASEVEIAMAEAEYESLTMAIEQYDTVRKGMLALIMEYLRSWVDAAAEKAFRNPVWYGTIKKVEAKYGTGVSMILVLMRSQWILNFINSGAWWWLVIFPRLFDLGQLPTVLGDSTNLALDSAKVYFGAAVTSVLKLLLSYAPDPLLWVRDLQPGTFNRCSDFCSPQSNKCYRTKKQEYYQSCSNSSARPRRGSNGEISSCCERYRERSEVEEREAAAKREVVPTPSPSNSSAQQPLHLPITTHVPRWCARWTTNADDASKFRHALPDTNGKSGGSVTLRTLRDGQAFKVWDGGCRSGCLAMGANYSVHMQDGFYHSFEVSYLDEVLAQPDQGRAELPDWFYGAKNGFERHDNGGNHPHCFSPSDHSHKGTHYPLLGVNSSGLVYGGYTRAMSASPYLPPLDVLYFVAIVYTFLFSFMVMMKKLGQFSGDLVDVAAIGNTSANSAPDTFGPHGWTAQLGTYQWGLQGDKSVRTMQMALHTRLRSMAQQTRINEQQQERMASWGIWIKHQLKTLFSWSVTGLLIGVTYIAIDWVIGSKQQIESYVAQNVHANVAQIVPPLLLSVINAISPFLVKLLTKIEHSTQSDKAKQLKDVLTRVYILKLINLFLIFKDLLALKRGSQLAATSRKTADSVTECPENEIGMMFMQLVFTDALIYTVVCGSQMLWADHLRAKAKRQGKEVELPEFDSVKSAQELIGIIYRQALIWVGAIFCPWLTLIAQLTSNYCLYILSRTLMTAHRPAAQPWSGIRILPSFLVASMMTLFVCMLPMTYWLQEQSDCGPFRGEKPMGAVGAWLATSAKGNIMADLVTWMTNPPLLLMIIVLGLLYLNLAKTQRGNEKRAREKLENSFAKERTYLIKRIKESEALIRDNHQLLSEASGGSGGSGGSGEEGAGGASSGRLRRVTGVPRRRPASSMMVDGDGGGAVLR